MDRETDLFHQDQPQLFDLGESSPGVLELFPEVWMAAEALTSPDVAVRRRGLERLLHVDAVRFSPLVAYVFATRLTEPALDLRVRIVQALHAALLPDRHGRPALEDVRQAILGRLAQMRTRQVYALVQLVDHDASLLAPVAVLLNACSYGGRHLADILENRSMPLAIRKQAAYLIGEVGYLDALPALRRAIERLETRLHGQQAMSFISPGRNGDLELLPILQKAHEILTAP